MRSKPTEMYRSKAEKALADWFSQKKIKFDYEKFQYHYTTRVPSGICDSCGHNKVSQGHWYLLDFWLPEYKFGIELKGRLSGRDRVKMEAVKKENPKEDIRLLFLSDNKIHPSSDKRYSAWANETGYKFAIKQIPEDWIKYAYPLNAHRS